MQQVKYIGFGNNASVFRNRELQPSLISFQSLLRAMSKSMDCSKAQYIVEKNQSIAFVLVFQII